MHLYCEIWDDEEHVQSFEMGTGRFIETRLFSPLIFLRKLERTILLYGGMSGYFSQCQPHGCPGKYHSAFYSLIVYSCIIYYRSMILFCVSILSFVWRSDAETDPKDRPPLSTNAALGLRILITFVFVLGLVYLGLIITTLKRYGTHGGTRGILGPGVERRGPGNADPARAREVDAAMERRGRERRRSTSHRVRTKEEPVEKAHAGDADAEADRSRETGREKGTPKSALGLTGMHPRLHGSTLDFDLEKGDDSSVLEFDR